jgi:hypothetical protein
VKCTRAEQSAVQKAEQFRGQAKDAITVGDMDRAAAYFEAASDWYSAAARMIAVRRMGEKRKAGVA